LLFADPVEHRGVQFFQEVCHRDCEGVVAEQASDGSLQALGNFVFG
jgi:hypothetical protein